MDSKPYNEWINLYNEDTEHVWYLECRELRNAAMLLRVLDNEFKRIYNNAETRFKACQKKINDFENPALDLLNDEKENIRGNQLPAAPSPVFSFNKSINTSTFNSNINTPDADGTILQDLNKNCVSPKINRVAKITRLKKLKRCNPLNYSSLEDNQTTPKSKPEKADVIDSTLIETTPDISDFKKKDKRSKLIDKTAKGSFRRKANITPTEKSSFCNTNNTKSTYSSDIIHLDSPEDISADNNIIKSKTTKQSAFPFVGPVVRGKERLKLDGWKCDDCEKFYNELGLNTQETKNVLNKCSRHRSRYKPEDYTPAGFWDLQFPQSPEKGSSDSTYFQY